VRIALAAAVARGLHSHEPRVEAILQIAAQDAVLDQHRTPGRRSLVVDVERATPLGDRAVVDHGDAGSRDSLADAAGEGRGLLAVEVALESVAHGLVQQDPRPAGAEHHIHGAGGAGHGVEIEGRNAYGLGNHGLPLGRREQAVEGVAAPHALVADLAPPARCICGDHLHVEPHQGPDVTDQRAVARRHQHHAVLADEARHHLPHARVEAPGMGVDGFEELDLEQRRHLGRGQCDRVEIARGPPRPAHRYRSLCPGVLGDRACRSGRDA